MTKAGFGFIVAGGFVYFVASQTQIGWLYLFDAIIWSLLLLSAILPWYSLRSLQVERQVLLPVSAPGQSSLGGPLEDETVEVELKVTNSGRWARHFIKVVEDCPFDQPEKRHRAFLVARLNPGSMTVCHYTATGYRRGYYASSSAILQAGGPLGLIIRRRLFQLPLNLTVYPAYYPMEGLPVADIAGVEWGHAARSNAAAEFSGSREYQYGEPLKYIHWRNTARRGQFMLKEFEQAGRGSVTVVFETGYDFGTGKETTLEYSIKIAASLVRLCDDSGCRINIIAGGRRLPDAGWREAMDYLARLEAAEKVALAEFMFTPEPGQVVVAIVPVIATGLVPVLASLAERVPGLVVVLLEGFAPDEAPGEFLAGLKRSNLEVISCPRGNLGAAIKRLSDFLFLTGKLP